MTNTQAAKILADFNRWRRGAGPDPDEILKVSPKDIGIAIDLAVKKLKTK